MMHHELMADSVLTQKETEVVTTLSGPVLERYRRDGGGPRFIRLSARRVGYRMSDLLAWMDERAEGGSQKAA